MSPFLYGHQTEFAYSKCGLTMALYDISGKYYVLEVLLITYLLLMDFISLSFSVVYVCKVGLVV